jgi:hypothetical protein
MPEINGQWAELTTPFLDRHNDYLQLYVRREGDGFLMTDDGHVTNELITAGIDLKNCQSRQRLQKILDGFGVELEGDQLWVYCTPEDFEVKKQSLVQAMLTLTRLTKPAELGP